MSKLPMNLPNKITIVRILLIPLYLVLLTVLPRGFNWPAAVVFAIASLTDMLDGQIARRRGLVTDFGKFMDPIADKLLVLLPMILMTATGGVIDEWAVMIMVAREIAVSGFRLVAVTKGIVIPAEWSGKLKTTIQMLAVLLLTLDISFGWYVAWAGALLSAYSGIEIIVRNRKVLEEPE